MRVPAQLGYQFITLVNITFLSEMAFCVLKQFFYADSKNARTFFLAHHVFERFSFFVFVLEFDR